ncbi:AAA-ATPase At3g28610 isoform X2 [Setaria italica]|uniref:AAA-ATPase At3g28610 isoform X2 n=1 Tax=Setaria italica TaxID=4555 RepID=UPI0003509826|nr:AAA-ATPase At3g28610 isoform X2 [Setaria italica]
MAEPGKVVRRWQRWAFANLGSAFTNFGSLWFILAPLVSLVATYAPRRLFQTYFNLFLRRRTRRVLNVVDPYVTIDISEPGSDVRYSRYGPVSDNDGTYEEVKAYLSGACSHEDARELRAEGAKDGDGLVISMRDGQDVADEFRGVPLWWSSVVDKDVQGQRQGKRRFQRLTFHLRHRRLVVDEYLPHVRRRGREILFSNRRRRLYTNSKSRDVYYESKSWSYIDFDHPTTFNTLAMDRAKKKDIMDDLDAFRNNRDFYRRTGKPWKRGYLLYGPPGTGKSTMVAAMANYLDYDIYDVELTVVNTNTDLRRLLIETTSKSIIVIEDIDCSLDLTGDRARQRRRPGGPPKDDDRYYADDRPRNTVTLSGLLNFIDGLWSASGGERIVVFTTNHVDKLDPALIRRGRMDMHIEMSYCGFEAFQTLAKNYLDIDDHELFGSVEEILREVKLTPADVAECLMTAKRAGAGEPSPCLEILIDELKKRAEEKEKAEAEAKAKAEAEAKAWAEAEAKAAAEAEAKAAAEANASEMARGNTR